MEDMMEKLVPDPFIKKKKVYLCINCHNCYSVCLKLRCWPFALTLYEAFSKTNIDSLLLDILCNICINIV